jgi:hypothetical protein
MTETVALIAALAAVAGLGGVIIFLMRRCAEQEESCRLLIRALADQRPAAAPQLRVIQGGRR